MILSRLPVLFVSALILAAPVAAQTAPPASQPGAQAQRPANPNARERQARPQPGQQQQRRRQAGDQPPAGQRQATPGQPQRPGGPGLNLDLSRQGTPAGTRPGGTQRAGDAFAASGPYATDAQMQRFTGRRPVAAPVQAPIRVFGDQQSGPSWAAPR